jgi:hypothetical protein
MARLVERRVTLYFKPPCVISVWHPDTNIICLALQCSSDINTRTDADTQLNKVYWIKWQTELKPPHIRNGVKGSGGLRPWL